MKKVNWISFATRPPTKLERKAGIWVWSGGYAHLSKYGESVLIGGDYWAPGWEDYPAPPDVAEPDLRQEFERRLHSLVGVQGRR